MCMLLLLDSIDLKQVGVGGEWDEGRGMETNRCETAMACVVHG